jgi:hypothetical protein
LFFFSQPFSVLFLKAYSFLGDAAKEHI